MSSALSIPRSDVAVPTLWLWGISPFCYKVRLAAAYKGVRLDERVLGLADRSRLIAATGLGKVPAIELPGRWISDSTAILRWLETQAPTPTLYPAKARDRAEDALLEDWADEALNGSVEPWTWTGEGQLVRLNALCAAEQTTLGGRVVMRALRGFMRRRWNARIERHGGPEATRALIGRQLDLLSARLGDRPWLFGEAPMASDFAVAAQLLNLYRFGRADDLEARPNVAVLVKRAGAMLPDAAWVNA